MAIQRTAIVRRQSLATVFVYALAISFLAAVPGMIFAFGSLALFFLAALLVGGSVHLGITGQYSSSMLQGAISVVLLYFLAPLQPLIFFTLLGHIILPGYLWHATTMIHDTDR